MEWYHQVLVLLALIAALLAWHVPRAVLWIGVGTFSYVTSAWWHQAGIPHGEVYGAATNVATCALIYYLGPPWSGMETRLMSVFVLMILVDLLYATGIIQTPYLFAVTLEIINAYALLLIWAAGITERITRNGFFRRYPYRAILDYLHQALLGPKKYPRWWENP